MRSAPNPHSLMKFNSHPKGIRKDLPRWSSMAGKDHQSIQEANRYNKMQDGKRPYSPESVRFNAIKNMHNMRSNSPRN